MSVAALSLVAMAQDAKAPLLTLSQSGRASRSSGTVTWGLPTVPGNILFYGGDTNTSDPNEQSFANGNTLFSPATMTYAPVTAPKNGGKIVASAVFFNQVATGTGGNVFDPATATYDVRTGLSEGYCGTDLTSGSGPQTAVLTDRQPFGFPEYTTTVQFTRPLTAKDGTTYWFNESPQCTDGSNFACQFGQFFLDNTTQQTNGLNANAQPRGQLYGDSDSFGATCLNYCTNLNEQQCGWASWGLLK
jgi:hypothetical protein